MPIDDVRHPFAEYFGRSFCLGCVAICYALLTALYSMIMIGSCMCFEACIDDLIQRLEDVGHTWINNIHHVYDLITIIEYQIESIR